MLLNRKSKDPYLGKNIVVTGGSSGIGLAIAKEFVRRGGQIFIIARDRQRLANCSDSLRTAHPGALVKVYPADITEESEVSAVITEIGQKFGGIHVLVINAGITAHGKFEDIELQQLRQVMDVNYFGAINCIKASLPFLQQQKDAQIGIVSSVASYLGFFGYSGYAPTKFALNGLTECLRMELSIPITVIYPPDTQTPMLERERKFNPPETQAISKSGKVLQPQQVANKLLRSMLKKRFEVFCNTESRLVRILRALWPTLLFWQLDTIVRKTTAKLNEA